MSTRSLAIACLLLGAALRITRVAEHPFLHADAPALLWIARDVLGEGSIARALGGYYPALYPAAIRLVHALGLDWEWAGRAVSCVAGIATVAATGLLAARLAGTAVGITAALVCAAHPGLVHASAEILAESLHGLFVAGWALLVFLPSRASAARLAAAGALAAVSSLVRAEGIALVPITIIAAGLLARRGERLRAMLAPALAAAAVLAPVLLAIQSATGSFALSGKEAPAILRRYGVESSSIGALVWNHPAAWLRVYPHSVQRQLTLTGGAIHGMLLVPLLVGLAAPPTGMRSVRTVALLVLVTFVLGIPLLAPGKRYVLPLLPILLPFAAVGLHTLARALAARSAPPRLLVGGATLVVAGLVAQAIWPPRHEEEECVHAICARAHAELGPSLPPFVVDDSRVTWVCQAPLVLRPPGLRGDPLLGFARRRRAGLLVVPPAEAPPEAAAPRALVCEGDLARALVFLR